MATPTVDMAGYDNKDCPGQVTYSVRQVKISVACLTGQVAISFYFGKIQGDSLKFLEHFKSYFGSKISSQSLNVYQLQPKSATKGDFFHIFLSLSV